MANTLEQNTFIDRLNNAEGALSELGSYADNLANRLVGYSDEVSEGRADAPSPSGFLPSVGDTASRMSRKIEDIRHCLNRINQALPMEKPINVAMSTGGQAGSTGKW